MEIISTCGFLKLGKATDKVTAFHLAHKGRLERHEGGLQASTAEAEDSGALACRRRCWAHLRGRLWFPSAGTERRTPLPVCHQALPKPLQNLDECDNKMSRKNWFWREWRLFLSLYKTTKFPRPFFLFPVSRTSEYLKGGPSDSGRIRKRQWGMWFGRHAGWVLACPVPVSQEL